jgi:ABC-type protease/lipase transport system fused ATPase/permease subunit
MLAADREVKTEILHLHGGKMKPILVVCFTAVLLVGMTLVSPSATPRPAPPTAPQASAKPGAPQRRERHPEIIAAMRALEAAKHHLESAAHDFGGHRVRALEHVNAALGECKAALEYDRR